MSEIISISVDEGTAAEMDAIARKEKFRSRSELVRVALRGYIAERKQMERLSGNVNAVLLMSYPCGKEQEVGRLKHAFTPLINFETHSHAGGMCIQSFSISGRAEKVREMYGKMGKCRKAGYCRMLIL